MKLPEKIKIGAFTYKIEGWHPPAAQASNCYGQFSHHEKVIRVDTSNDAQQIRETLLHEIFHAIYYVWGLDDKDEEERIVSQYGTAFTAVMADNPDIRKWFNRAWGQE